MRIRKPNRVTANRTTVKATEPRANHASKPRTRSRWADTDSRKGHQPR
jgi:hypothetical protein